MDKRWSTNQLLHATFTIIIILIIVIALIINLPDDDMVDESDWTEYPYVIPGTELRFPDVEGETEGEKWISIGMKLESPEINDLKIVLLYHPDFKSTFLFGLEEPIYQENIRGDMLLEEGTGFMKFEHEGHEAYDIIEPTERAFTYDFTAKVPLNEGITESMLINVSLESTKPPATMHDGRVDVNHGYYHFFALTNCEVEGFMEIDGEQHPVKGTAWIEHQWGDFKTLDWDWFCIWGDDNIELAMVHLRSGDTHLDYIIHVGPEGELTTIHEVTINTTSKNKGYGYTWEITSYAFDITLNITILDDMTIYGSGYVVGFGSIEGHIMGTEIDTLTYIETTLKDYVIPMP